MRSVDVLRSEHRLIARGLGVCEALAAALRQGRHVPASDLAALLDFFVVYADGHHQRREEIVVASWLRSHGVTATEGAVACMHHEHRSTRGHLRALAGYARSPEPDAASVIRELSGLVFSLRESIREEESRLFPVLDSLVEHDDELLGLFADCLPHGARLEADYQGVIARLESIYVRASRRAGEGSGYGAGGSARFTPQSP